MSGRNAQIHGLAAGRRGSNVQAGAQSDDDGDSSFDEFQWDDDPERAGRMRAILRELELQRQRVGEQREIIRSMLQAELQREKDEALKDFLNQIEEHKYSGGCNEFDQQDCVICMEAFKEGKKVKRIPNCRHFFHPECIMQWFESKC